MRRNWQSWLSWVQLVGIFLTSTPSINVSGNNYGARVNKGAWGGWSQWHDEVHAGVRVGRWLIYWFSQPPEPGLNQKNQQRVDNSLIYTKPWTKAKSKKYQFTWLLRSAQSHYRLLPSIKSEHWFMPRPIHSIFQFFFNLHFFSSVPSTFFLLLLVQRYLWRDQSWSHSELTCDALTVSSSFTRGVVGGHTSILKTRIATLVKSVDVDLLVIQLTKSLPSNLCNDVRILRSLKMSVTFAALAMPDIPAKCSCKTIPSHPTTRSDERLRGSCTGRTSWPYLLVHRILPRKEVRRLLSPHWLPTPWSLGLAYFTATHSLACYQSSSFSRVASVKTAIFHWRNVIRRVANTSGPPGHSVSWNVLSLLS